MASRYLLDLAMKKFGVLDARKLFYSILDGEIDEKRGLEELTKIKTKNKVLKGYIFGVISIFSKRNRRYSFDIGNADPYTIKKLREIVSSLGDNRFLPDFEKGYFLSWKDYINYITRKVKEADK